MHIIIYNAHKKHEIEIPLCYFYRKKTSYRHVRDLPKITKVQHWRQKFRVQFSLPKKLQFPLCKFLSALGIGRRKTQRPIWNIFYRIEWLERLCKEDVEDQEACM